MKSHSMTLPSSRQLPVSTLRTNQRARCEKWQPGAAELSRLRRLILQRIWVAGAVEAAIRLTLRVLREFEKRRDK